MNFDVLTNNLLNLYGESVYTTKRPELKLNTGTKKGSGITEAEKKQAEKIILQKTQEFKKDPQNASILLDLFNTVREFPDDGVINKKFTKQEYLKGLLDIAKKSGKDYGLVLKSELGGESKSIDEWKARYGEADKPYYYAIKAIIDYMGGNTQERSIKEVASSTVELYYFDSEGHPWRTYVSVGEDGKVGPSALSQPPLNRQMYKLTGKNMTEHPPVYFIDGEEMPARWRPPELRGQDIEFVRNALTFKNEDELTPEQAFKSLYPSEVSGVSTGTYGMGGRTGTRTKKPTT